MHPFSSCHLVLDQSQHFQQLQLVLSSQYLPQKNVAVTAQRNHLSTTFILPFNENHTFFLASGTPFHLRCLACFEFRPEISCIFPHAHISLFKITLDRQSLKVSMRKFVPVLAGCDPATRRK